MGLFDAIGIAGSGLTAERIRMDVTAENLANADTTKAANGQPYQRQEVELAQVGSSDFGGALSSAIQQSGGAQTPGGVQGDGDRQRQHARPAGLRPRQPRSRTPRAT